MPRRRAAIQACVTNVPNVNETAGNAFGSLDPFARCDSLVQVRFFLKTNVWTLARLSFDVLPYSKLRRIDASSKVSGPRNLIERFVGHGVKTVILRCIENHASRLLRVRPARHVVEDCLWIDAVCDVTGVRWCSCSSVFWRQSVWVLHLLANALRASWQRMLCQRKSMTAVRALMSHSESPPATSRVGGVCLRGPSGVRRIAIRLGRRWLCRGLWRRGRPPPERQLSGAGRC
jgi:hypothetical protein